MKCHFCKESGFSLEEGREFYAGFACDYCATECPACGDWLGNEPEVIVNGQRWHKVCAEEDAQQAHDAKVIRPLFPEAA